MKYESRATRAANAAAVFSDAASKLREVIDELKSLQAELDEHECADDLLEQEDSPLAQQFASLVTKAQTALENVGDDEVQTLAEEMGNWRDNYPENLQGTDKYDKISEAADTCESVADVIGNLELVPEPEDEDDPDSFASALEGIADELEEAQSNLESVEFPGMYG